MSTQGPVSVHRLLQFKMLEMGYKISYQGICAGFIGMWSQAVLVGDQNRFHDRLAVLMSLPPNYLQQVVGQLRFKLKPKNKRKKSGFYPSFFFPSFKEQNITNELILEIPAFMDGVFFHQETIADPGYFGTPLYKQDFKQRASVVSSKKLKDMKGVSEIYSFSGLFTREDFLRFYQNLEQATQCLDKNQPFVVPLSNLEHRVALAWDGENIVFCDINSNNILSYKSLLIKNAEDFANKVIDSFKSEHKNNDNVAWNQNFESIVGYVYTAKTNENAISIIIDEHIGYLSDTRQIDNNKINQQDALGQTWLHNAIYANNIDMIKALALSGADISLFNYRNQSVLFFVIQNGDEALFNAIKPALLHNPDILNTNDMFGNNALHIAVFSKNIIALNALIEIYPEILDLENLLGETALHAAVRQNSVGAVTMLLVKGAEIDYENKYGDSPFSIAMSMENIHPKIIDLFKLYQNKDMISEIAVKIESFKEKVSKKGNAADELNQYLSRCHEICTSNHPDKLNALMSEFVTLPIPENLPDDIQDIIEEVKGSEENVSSRFKP